MADFKTAKDKRFKVFQKPSCGAIAGTKIFEPCIAPKNRIWAAVATDLCSVTPLTNITPFDLDYQLYLNAIFHRENLSFYVHAITMPLVVLFLLATAAELKFESTTFFFEEYNQWLDLSFVFAGLLFLWYIVWGFIGRVWWLGLGAMPIIAACYVGGHYYEEYATATIHPMIWVAVCSTIQSWSHIVEYMPPRVSGTPHWTSKTDFFCREVSNVWEFAERSFRALIQAFVFGTLDELIASPRLLPFFWSICPIYNIMKWLNITGPTRIRLDGIYAEGARSLEEFPRIQIHTDTNGQVIVEPLPQIKLSWLGRAMLYMANTCFYPCCRTEGPPDAMPDPALDFIGTGGGIYLRSNYTLLDILFCRHCSHVTEDRFTLDYRAASNNLCGLAELDIDNFEIGTTSTIEV